MGNNIIAQLASQLGVRSNEPNKEVAKKCIGSPEFLKDIAACLSGKNSMLVADCAEVFTEVAQTRPDLITGYALQLIPLLKHKYTRARWEAMHALALVAIQVPEIIFSILPDLDSIMHNDKSVIVRDWATEAIARYAGTSAEAAGNALPLLHKILKVWGAQHASRILDGFGNIYKVQPSCKNEFQRIADEYRGSNRGVVRKAAGKLDKMLNQKIKQ